MRFLYYVILLPFSLLPSWVLYRISDIMYLVLYRIMGYRKTVVRTNIQNSFPEYTAKERLSIEREFFVHFCDIIIESIKTFSISEKELEQRFVHSNPEIFKKYFDSGQHVTLVGGHYGNWEMFAVSAAKNIPHHPLALFTPLRNKFMNTKITNSRSRFGLRMKSYPEVKEILKDGIEKQLSIIFATDQCPRLRQHPHWTMFLNQETAVQFGSEKFARDNNTPVIYGIIEKTKRGHYSVKYTMLSEFPNELAIGELSEMHTRQLEKDIIENPSYWLWTHKRWKRKKIDFQKHWEKQEASKLSA